MPLLRIRIATLSTWLPCSSTLAREAGRHSARKWCPFRSAVSGGLIRDVVGFRGMARGKAKGPRAADPFPFACGCPEASAVHHRAHFLPVGHEVIRRPGAAEGDLHVLELAQRAGVAVLVLLDALGVDEVGNVQHNAALHLLA